MTKKYTVERAEHFLRLPRPLPGTEQTEALIQRYLMEQRAKLVDALAVCESPREVDFALALLAAGDKDGSFVELCKAGDSAFAEGRGVRVCAQYTVTLPSLKKSIRIDFAIFGRLSVAVEIDGHDGHSSKAQRSADAARDRELSAMGWRPFRFTGSEMFAGAQERADQVYRFLGLTPGVGTPIRAATPPTEAPASGLDPEDIKAQIRAAEERGDIEESNRLLKLSFDRARQRMGLTGTGEKR